MADIVERLRSAKTWLNEGECCGQIDASGTCAAPACIFGEALKLSTEAADKIEKLRAALEELIWYANQLELDLYDPDDWPETHGAVKAARAALEEK